MVFAAAQPVMDEAFGGLRPHLEETARRLAFSFRSTFGDISTLNIFRTRRSLSPPLRLLLLLPAGAEIVSTPNTHVDPNILGGRLLGSLSGGATVWPLDISRNLAPVGVRMVLCCGEPERYWLGDVCAHKPRRQFTEMREEKAQLVCDL